MKPSPTLAAMARVDGHRAAGRAVIDFTIGEPDFPTPPHIVDAAIQALTSGQTKYTASSGIPALRDSIATKLARENGLSYQPEQVVVGCGAKHIIHSAFAATLNEGDEVIIPAPHWASYPDIVTFHGGRPVALTCNHASGFKLSADRLETAITHRTRWLVLNSPNNPAGAVYSPAELHALAGVLVRHPGVLVMSDEVYEHFVYEDSRHVSIGSLCPALRHRLLVVNSLSKTYAMTGWRIGYAVGPPALISAITGVITQSVSCACSISQAAAVAALQGPQACVTNAVNLFHRRRDRMVELLNDIPGVSCACPEGAFYAFASVGALIGARTPSGVTLSTDLDVMTYFLDAAGVATIDGSAYGMSAYLRMSFATPIEQIEAGCLAIGKAVRALASAILSKEN